MSGKEIWEEVLRDLEDETPEECAIIESLQQLHTGAGGDPIYNAYFSVSEHPEVGSLPATLIWQKQHVMLFLDELSEEYEESKQIGWHCFCTSDHFDADEFLTRIGAVYNGNDVS